jgi:regulator of sigma E protease
VKEEGVKLPAMKGITRQVSTRCVLHEIKAGSVAEKAGLKANDVIKSLDGKPVADAADFIGLVKGRAGDELSVVVVRDGKELPLKVTPSYDKERDRAMVGAVVGTMVISLPWMQEKKPLAQLKADAGGITRLLKALVNHKESAHAASGLGGPVMIFAALWGSIKISIFNAIGFLRFLNVNLAILNMLPIPVLDGGHIMFSLWEMVTRRKVNEKVVNALVNIFAVLLIGTFLILTTRDVGTVFPKTKKLFSWAHKEEVATNVVESASNTNRTEEVSPQ